MQKDIDICPGSNTGKWWINNETPYLTLDCLTYFFLLIWLSDEFIIQLSLYVLLLSHVFISVPSKITSNFTVCWTVFLLNRENIIAPRYWSF